MDAPRASPMEIRDNEADLEACAPAAASGDAAEKSPHRCSTADWSAASTAAESFSNLYTRSGTGITVLSDGSSLPAVDEELGLSVPDNNGNGSAEGMDAGKEARKPGLFRRLVSRRRVSIPLLLGMATFAACVVVFFPRYPTWKLANLELDVQAFVGEITGTRNATEPLKVVAEVDVWNPNFVGARIEHSTFFALYYGGEYMGNGTTIPGVVKRRATSRLRVEVEIQLTDSLAEHLMEGAIANNFQIAVGAQVVTPVKVGPIGLKVDVQCHVVAAAMRLFKNPTDVLIEQQCTYRPAL